MQDSQQVAAELEFQQVVCICIPPMCDHSLCSEADILACSNGGHWTWIHCNCMAVQEHQYMACSCQGAVHHDVQKHPVADLNCWQSEDLGRQRPAQQHLPSAGASGVWAHRQCQPPSTDTITAAKRPCHHVRSTVLLAAHVARLQHSYCSAAQHVDLRNDARMLIAARARPPIVPLPQQRQQQALVAGPRRVPQRHHMRLHLQLGGKPWAAGDRSLKKTSRCLRSCTLQRCRVRLQLCPP
jgi:hypothetical protein